jgi:hypothetical protein
MPRTFTTVPRRPDTFKNSIPCALEFPGSICCLTLPDLLTAIFFEYNNLPFTVNSSNRISPALGQNKLTVRAFLYSETLFMKKHLTVVLWAELTLWLNTCFIAHTASQSLVSGLLNDQ